MKEWLSNFIYNINPKNMNITLTKKQKIITIASIVAAFVIFSLILTAVLLITRRGLNGKNNTEVCFFKECIIKLEDIKKGNATQIPVCIPKGCVSFTDMLGSGRICTYRRCFYEGNDEKSSNKICFAKDCLTSPRKMEKIGVGDMCLTQECILSSSTILNTMDQSVDPCVNFFEFSCGGFLKKIMSSETTSEIHISQKSEEKISRRIKDILEKPSDSSTDLSTAKQIYKTCLDNTLTEKMSVSELKTLFTTGKIGEWPSLSPKSKDCTLDLEWKMAMLNVYGVDSLFRLEVPEIKIANWTMFGSVSIAKPLIDGICDRDFVTDDGNLTVFAVNVTRKYREAMRRVYHLLEVPLNITEKDIDDILRFDAKFCIASKPSRQHQLYHKASNQTLKDMISIAPQINWSRWHSLIFFEWGLGHRLDKSPIYVYGIDLSARALGELLSNTSGKTLSNYLSWKFVYHHLGFMATSFIQIAQDNPPSYEGNGFFVDAKATDPRWKQCVNYVSRVLPVALVPTYFAKMIGPELKKEMSEITSSLRKAYNATFKKTPHLLTPEKTSSMKKITNLKFKLFHPDDDHIYQGEYYAQVGKLSNSFLENGMKMRKFHYSKIFDDVIHKRNVTNTEHVMMYHNPFRRSSLSNFLNNVIMLSFASVESTGIDHRLPRYLNMGSFGSMVSQQIAKGFDLRSIKGDHHLGFARTNWTYWPSYVVHYAQRKTRCFADHLFEDSFPTLYTSAEKSLLDSIVADNQGIQVAFQVYKNYSLAEKKPRNLYIPGVKYSKDQLFFIKYAQNYCSLKSSNGKVHLPNQRRINEALRNTKIFPNVFLCQSGTPMNPIKKCDNLWQ